MHRDGRSRPLHPALLHSIVSSPNPDTVTSSPLPDGTKTTIVILREDTPPHCPINDPKRWWPTAASESGVAKLEKKFYSEHFLFPSVVVVVTTLLSEVYGTDYIPASRAIYGRAQTRVRLRYRDSPLADFGIVKGRFRANLQDRFSYYSPREGKFFMGMDPNDHYWIFFTNAKGEEVYLDCGLFTYIQYLHPR